jgi:DNA-binding transcriptional MerR regulator
LAKSEKAFRTITEAAEILKLPAHVLRFWESKFKYIKPMKRGGGRRYYRPEDVHLLLGIKQLLYSNSLTIKGAQKVIQTNGVRAIVKLGLESVPNQKHAGQKLRENLIETVNLNWPNLVIETKMSPNKNVNTGELTELLSRLKRIRNTVKLRCA